MQGDPTLRELGRLLLLLGLLLAACGVVLLLAGRTSWLPRLPGDLVLRGRRVTAVIPIVTCVLLSAVLTLLLNLFFRR